MTEHESSGNDKTKEPERTDHYHKVFSQLLEKPIKRSELIAKIREAGFAQASALSYISWSKRPVDESEENPYGFQTENYKDAEGNVWLLKKGDPVPTGLTKAIKDADSEGESESQESRSKAPGIWKIAPGESAFFWDVCRDKNFIAIGWSAVGNFRQYSTREELKAALRQSYDGKDDDRSIWPFVHQVELGDIVVANRGLDEIVGIGIVTSDYIPGKDPNNPSTDNDLTNVRKVNWLITKPVEFSKNFFVRPTLTRLRNDQWDDIQSEYRKKYPNDMEITTAFNNLGVVEMPAEESDNSTISTLMQLTPRTRNLLLYGPPGTGKTWNTNHFAMAFLLQRNYSNEKAESYLRAAQQSDLLKQKELRELLIPSAPAEGEDVAFWWMVANDKNWSWNSLFAQGEQFF
jgi:hypothetical protein